MRYSVATAPEPPSSVRMNAIRTAPKYSASGAAPLIRAVVTGAVPSTLRRTVPASSSLPATSVERNSHDVHARPAIVTAPA